MKHSKRRREFPIEEPPVDLPPTALTISGTSFITSSYRPGVALIQNCLGTAITSVGGLNAALARLGECVMTANVHSQGFNENTITPNELWVTIANPPSATAPYKSGVWSYLDTRLEQLKNAGVTAYISLLCPYWMQRPGTSGDGINGYAFIDQAHPDAEHISSMAQLVSTIVTRYKVGGVGNPGGTVNRITGGLQTWNEWKGLNSFDDGTAAAGGDHVRMTNNYNAMWDAAKAADPTVKMGGPYMNFQNDGASTADTTAANYLAFTDWFTGVETGFKVYSKRLDSILYWWANKRGADFYIAGAANKNAHDVARWVRAQLSSTIPIIHSETYPGEKADDLVTKSDAYYRRLSARLAENMRKECISGYSGTQIWGPEESSASAAVGGFANAMWKRNATATKMRAGEISQLFKDHFSAGTPLYQVTTNDKLITGVASADYILVISNRTDDIDVNVDGVSVAIPYESYTLVPR